jgi:hypothetical protein
MVHILDDDSLLNIFYIYRPFLLGENEDDDSRLGGGDERWAGERWWYKLAHVCQRWRNLILGSSSYLGLCLVCTNGTPVADMLAHSPPLPLVVEYDYEDPDMAAEDEEGFTLAFQERDRVRRVRLRMPVPTLQKLITAISEEYPKLEYLIIVPSAEDTSTIFTLPESFQAPHLRHLVLFDFAFPIGSRLLTTAMGLITLALALSNPSTYFQPNVLLRWISYMPQLETLMITFLFTVPDSDLETRSTHTPTTTHITLPNLRWFWFRGVSAYLEAVVPQIATPRLEKLEIFLFEQPMFSVPRLVQFMKATENLKFRVAKIHFSDEQFDVEVYPREDAETYALHLGVICWPFERQVSSVAQIFNASSQILSAVEHLTLEQEGDSLSHEEQNAVGRSQWHKFLRSFSNVKILRVNYGLVQELSRCLRLDDGEPSLVLLPKLQELVYTGSSNSGDAFIPFINARRDTGRPITLVRRSPSPSRSESPSEGPTLTSTPGDVENDSNT